MSEYVNNSDPVLISLLRASDHAAYTEVYNRYYYLMFVFAYKKLKDQDLAKDMVQDLFTSLWLKREDILETGNLAAYLYTTLRNKVVNHFAHNKVELKYSNSLKDYITDGNSASADHLVREKQLKFYIEKQIQALPKRMRRVFELSKKDNLSNKEIAEKLDITDSNVSQHVNNALRILKTKLSSMLLSMFF